MSTTSVAPNTHTTTVTRLNGQWLWLGRIIWTVLFLFTLTMFVIAARIRFDKLNTPCNANCITVQISDEGVATLQSSLGMSITTYAIVIIFKEILLSLIYMFVGVLIFWRRSDDWLVILISLTLIMVGPSFGVFFVVNNPAIYALQGIGFFLTINLFLLFPDGHFAPRWMGWTELILIPYIIVPFFPPLLTPQNILYIGVLLSIGFASQFYRYRQVASSIQRQQTKWIVFGFGVFLVGMLFLGLPSVLFPSLLTPLTEPSVTVADFVYRAVIGFFLGFFPMYFLPITIAFSTLRHRLWDADPIINRSLVYGFMTLGVIVMLFILTLLTQFIFGKQQPLVAIGIAGVISVLTFNPAHRHIRHFVDHNIYGFRYDLNELKVAQQLPEIKNPGALTGQVIDGYEIRGVIGKGGMGEVYRGFGNGQQVAIKTMLPEFARDEAMRKRFEREAQAGQTLKHPNIAQIITSGTFNETPYLIMEYIEGSDLSTRIKQDKALDTKTTTTILRKVCSALDVAHQQGYVHRDIKPGNIMIRENGDAVLMDFGIIKMLDTTSALTGTGVIGTIDYMAPEQITAATEVDHRADIYSLGVILYEMLTGEKPFSGGVAQIIFAHLQQPPPDAHKTNSAIPLDLSDVIERAMAKDPENRYASVLDFADALQF